MPPHLKELHDRHQQALKRVKEIKNTIKELEQEQKGTRNRKLHQGPQSFRIVREGFGDAQRIRTAPEIHPAAFKGDREHFDEIKGREGKDRESVIY